MKIIQGMTHEEAKQFGITEQGQKAWQQSTEKQSIDVNVVTLTNILQRMDMT